MKDSQIKEKIKYFFLGKWNDFCEWFKEKEHPHSRLNKNVFFHDLLKLIGLILVFLIVYSNVDKLNQIVLIFIKIGSLLQLVLIFFILRKAWHLTKNLKYAFKGLNHGTKAIIAIAIVLLLFVAFLNQDKVVNSITENYDKANFTKINPLTAKSLNISFFNTNKTENSNLISKIINTPSSEDSLISKCKASYESCKEISTEKYAISISLIKAEKFEDESKALEFYNTWKSPLQFGLEIELTGWSYDKKVADFLPIVLLASKVNGPEGQLPVVLICDKGGNLIGSSKSQLLCG